MCGGGGGDFCLLLCLRCTLLGFQTGKALGFELGTQDGHLVGGLRRLDFCRLLGAGCVVLGLFGGDFLDLGGFARHLDGAGCFGHAALRSVECVTVAVFAGRLAAFPTMRISSTRGAVWRRLCAARP